MASVLLRFRARATVGDGGWDELPAFYRLFTDRFFAGVCRGRAQADIAAKRSFEVGFVLLQQVESFGFGLTAKMSFHGSLRNSRVRCDIGQGPSRLLSKRFQLLRDRRYIGALSGS